MFFCEQNIETQNKYELLLRIIGALSKLSTDNSSVPYLYYRMAENKIKLTETEEKTGTEYLKYKQNSIDNILFLKYNIKRWKFRQIMT